MVNLKDAEKIITDGRLTFALFDYRKIDSNRNVFGFSFDGHQIWQIAEPYKIHAENYYAGIYFRENELSAYCVNGVEVSLDKNTGKEISSQLIK